MKQPTFPGAIELAAQIARREVSPVEVAEQALAAIESLNGTLHCFLDHDPEVALRRAREAETRLMGGGDLPPLLGVPVAVKDVEDTEDYRSTAGSLVQRERRAGVDALHVQRLRAAGAVVLGKTNTPEFALLGETRNRLGPECSNPWDPGRTTGGSSGGSAAAVAAGIVPLATGTDTAGSITIPSGFCGSFGIKPTHRRIPVWPNSDEWPMFYDTGPITRNVADAALALSLMAGFDARDPHCLRAPAPAVSSLVRPLPQGLRVAVAETLAGLPAERLNRDAVRRTGELLAELGCVVEAEAPSVEAPAAILDTIGCVDEYRYRGHLLEQHREVLEPSTVEFMQTALVISALELAEAHAGRQRVRAAFDAFFERFDVLLAPATACPAFPRGAPPALVDGRVVEPLWSTFAPFNMYANLTGCPLGCVPSATDDEPLPLGVLVFAPPGREDIVLSVAAAIEEARPWTGRVPPVSVTR